MTVPSLRAKVSLGRTSLKVSRLGIGSSYGVSERACRLAFDQGVNYFFWGSVRSPGMGRAIRHIGKRERERLVVVLQLYVRSPALASRSVERGLKALGLDYADVLLLGWHDTPPRQGLLAAVEKLREAGRFRHLGISSHQRPLFREFLQHGKYDLFHVRYNAAHTGAETDLFPYLPEENAPGIVSFTNTRWGSLLQQKYMPSGETPPTAAECYRFALSNPNVQVALCGPKNDEQMEHALAALSAGPLDGERLAWMRTIGQTVHGKTWLMNLLG